MGLSRRERFHLRTALSDKIAEPSEWSWDRINLLLGEFNLASLDDYQGSPTFGELIGDLSDNDLIEMYSIVTGVELNEVRDDIDSSVDPGNWKPQYVRLFISHSASHKDFVGKVANELAVTGIHGFVAHDTMAYSKPWQAQIEQALRSMQAFVAIIHPEFNDSAWCHQEIGWALSRRIPTYAIRMGSDPAGFIGNTQWPSAHNQQPKQISQIISTWVSTVPELNEIMTDGLFTALEHANNYMDAGATAKRIAALSGLNGQQWDRLDQIWWSNDQLHNGALPTKALKPFYAEHDRSWPPPKPAPTTSGPDDHLSLPLASSDEPPF